MIKEKIKKNFTKNNFILFLNIFVVIFFLIFIMESQKYAHLHFHDFVMPYLDDFSSKESIRNIFFSLGRIPARFLSFSFLNWMPEFFKINPNDFVSGFSIGGILLSFFVLFTCYILTKAFFILDNDSVPIIKRKEFSVVFLSISLMFAITLKNKITLYPMFGISEYATYFEYLFPFVFFVIFYIYLFKILTDVDFFKKSKKHFALMLINTFILCFWSETYIVLIAFSLFLLFFILLIQKKKEILCGKEIFTLLNMFALGSVYFLFFSGYMYTENITGRAHVQIDLFDRISVISNYLPLYYKHIIKNNFLYILLIGLFGVFLSFILKYKKNEKVSAVLIISSIILFSYFSLNFMYLLFPDLGCIFTRGYNRILNENILELILIFMFGTIFFFFDKKKVLFLIFTILMTMYSVVSLAPEFLLLQKIRYESKKALYEFERRIFLYDSIYEIPIIPASCVIDDDIYLQGVNELIHELRKEREIKDFPIIFDFLITKYSTYFNYWYKNKIYPICLIEDDITALEDWKSVLNILQIDENQFFDKNLNFSKIRKIENYLLQQISDKNIKEIISRVRGSDIELLNDYFIAEKKMI